MGASRASSPRSRGANLPLQAPFPVIPAKGVLTLRAENLTQRREGRKEMGNIGAIIVHFSLGRTDIRLK